MPARLAIALAAVVLLGSASSGQAPAPTDAVVLITLDGARTQEIFGGLDAAVLKSTLKEDQRVEDSPLYKKFWAPTADERRRKILPFFWTLVTEQGSIAGNRTLGSSVTLRNRRWFSYPGYAEILGGDAFDKDITSNDPIRNPRETVLERIGRERGLSREQVATFASWDVFNAIVEHTEGATTTNAGFESLPMPDAETGLLNALQTDARAPWDDARQDVFTFRLAMRHLERARPRVLYLAFNDTDSWAHEGRYDRLLDAYVRSDRYLQELWTWLQGQPDYKGRTHLLITTDHGRGDSPKDWGNHGDEYPGAEHTWIAFVSPTMPQRGEWKGGEPLSTSQVAATIASWMGVDWNADHPNAGKPIR